MKKLLEMAPAKRRDPNYIQLNTDVEKNIGLKFKATCALKQISLGTGLEEAIRLWLANEEAQNND